MKALLTLVVVLTSLFARAESRENLVGMATVDCSNQAIREARVTSFVSEVALKLSYGMMTATPVFRIRYHACINQKMKSIFRSVDKMAFSNLKVSENLTQKPTITEAQKIALVEASLQCAANRANDESFIEEHIADVPSGSIIAMSLELLSRESHQPCNPLAKD